MSIISFTGMLPEEINAYANEQGIDLPSFAGVQIIKWIAQGLDSFDGMTNLSKFARTHLSQCVSVYSSHIINRFDDPDGTVKLQIQTADENNIEAVLLTDAENRKTACVSSQAGCAMACVFCKTGTLGLARNLTVSEIVEQFYFLEKIAGESGECIDTLVFMGMGEPLCNLDVIRKAIAVLAHPNGRNFSRTRITLSTCGVVSGIIDLAHNGPDIRLAVSLTSAVEHLRMQLMPIAHSYSLTQLHEAVALFCEKTNNRVTFEITLFHELNTTQAHIDALLQFIRGLHVHINLIPWNPIAVLLPLIDKGTTNLILKEPQTKEVEMFMAKLEKADVSVTIRTRRGRTIGGACGQLGSLVSPVSH